MTPSYDGTQLPSFQAVPVPQHPSPSQSSLGACVLVGQGAGDDQVFVGAGDDQVFVGAGDDQVFVGAGDDQVFVGAGDDQVFVGAGDDQVFVGTGDDQVFVGAAVVLVSDVEQVTQHKLRSHPGGASGGSLVQSPRYFPCAQLCTAPSD